MEAEQISRVDKHGQSLWDDRNVYTTTGMKAVYSTNVLKSDWIVHWEWVSFLEVNYSTNYLKSGHSLFFKVTNGD